MPGFLSNQFEFRVMLEKCLRKTDPRISIYCVGRRVAEPGGYFIEAVRVNRKHDNAMQSMTAQCDNIDRAVELRQCTQPDGADGGTSLTRLLATELIRPSLKLCKVVKQAIIIMFIFK